MWVSSSRENAERLLKALDAFGFGALGLTVEDFVHPDSVIQLGQPPQRIYLLASLAGVTFEDCYSRRTPLPFSGLVLPFIDLERLKQNKRATGRTQDLADVEELE